MKYLDVPSSGSIADRTHSHNRAGQYTRNRRSPVQPLGTGRRAFIRSAFGNVSTAYGGLTDAERAAWTTYADGRPVVDRLGQSIKLTGHQMFVAINVQLLNLGGDIETTPPPSSEVTPATGVVLTATAGTPALSVAWDAASVDDQYCFAFARPQPPGRSFVNAFWQAGFAAGDEGPFVATTLFVAQFGALAIGQKIFCKVTPVNQYGVTGTPVVVSKVIVA